MAKVKFVQIGHDTLSYTDYAAKLATAKANYPGAIIFGTYYSEEKVKKVQEIWANGVQYSVGAGSDAKFYEGTESPEDYFSAGHAGASYVPQHGDYYIKNTDLTPGISTDSIVSKTAYCYDSVNRVWVALDGNVDASNVYFPQGIDRTEKFGWKPESEDVIEKECHDMNLKDLMEYYLVKAKFPTVTGSTANITAPSWSISENSHPTFGVYTDSACTAAATNNSTVEVGTVFYVPAMSYNTAITATQGSDALTNGSTKTFSIGPSKLSGLKYGFWSKSDYDEGKTTDADRVDSTTHDITFDGSTITRIITPAQGETPAVTKTYTTNNTGKTSTITYTYSNTGTSGLKYDISNFTPSVTTLEVTDTGDKTITLPTRSITVGDTGNNTIKLYVKNLNSWSRSFSNNTVPATNTVYVASNKYTPYDYDNKTKTASVSAVTVSSDLSKTSDCTTYTQCGSTFKAVGVYPIYINNVKQSITLNHTNITNHEFVKPGVAMTSYTVSFPKSLGTPTVQVFAAGQWGPCSGYTSAEGDKTINSNCTIRYTTITFPVADGKDTKYRFSAFAQ